ncbi:imidazole glycerol phosphate synthase subunit HisH [Slackia sp.]|uniref:imidazole glycerol phosphate synthase subunit HisH n=1 Tax=Slackia sp. TaxID=2049041 RepID=UPI002E764781|nr:imidazole glycerol phosphate synthase subunit HisH [Slackia sp.]MEE0518748.1 imidazole glycerol phosphate synthase subunit HisH [Slackia sp.]
MARIVVVDYHKGNLMSVERGLSAAGADVFVSDDPAAIRAADAVVLPGVGSFADAMAYMRESGQADAVVESVRAGRPFLGICLGMQLLFDRGEEGASCGEWIEGLGLLHGSCVRFPACGLKVPHVGWDDVSITAQGKRLLSDVSSGSHFYFTHSYIVEPDSDDVVACWTDYGVRFAAAVASGMVFGCQFHPEKSSGKGREVLRNFVRIVQECEQASHSEDRKGEGLS